MKINDKESAIVAMNELFYYAMNFKWEKISYENYRGSVETKWVPEFVKDVEYGCDVQHIIGIWESCYEDAGTWGGFMAFYSRLDNRNRRKLLEYIIDTYDSGSMI